MIYYCYIIYSKIKDRYYIGYTGDELAGRLRRHNAHHSGYSGRVSDWELVYSESFDDKSSALARERQIKERKSRKYIEALISGSERSRL